MDKAIHSPFANSEYSDEELEARRFELDRLIEASRAELYALNREQERRQFEKNRPAGDVVVAIGNGVTVHG